MTPNQQWSKELFSTIKVPIKDTTKKSDYTEEAVIDKAIIDKYFTKVRLNEKQAGWANKKEVQNPPDMYNEVYNEQPQPPAEDLEPFQPPPSLEPPQYVHPTSKAMAKPAGYIVGKKSPAIVAELDEIETTKEIALENNEDKEDKNRMESLMDNVQVQPWWQYEDD
eukprot:109539-Amphidinium_carterae.1